jgi:hypothetical protein
VLQRETSSMKAETDESEIVLPREPALVPMLVGLWPFPVIIGLAVFGSPSTMQTWVLAGLIAVQLPMAVWVRVRRNRRLARIRKLKAWCCPWCLQDLTGVPNLQGCGNCPECGRRFSVHKNCVAFDVKQRERSK